MRVERSVSRRRAVGQTLLEDPPHSLHGSGRLASAAAENPAGPETWDVNPVEPEHLAPNRPLFVETGEVKDIKSRAMRWLSAGCPIHIIGPTGCGKTTLAMEIAYELGRPVTWVNGDDQITTEDLVGSYKEFEQQTYRDRFVHNVFKGRDMMRAIWVDNPLTIACKHGYTFVYNEFSRAKPEANNVLLSVLEERILELPTMAGQKRYVKVDPNFRAILTSNSVEYAGIHRAQDALLDRIVGLCMDYYGLDTEVRIVTAHTGLAEGEARKIVEIFRALRKELDEGERPGTRACIMVARALERLDDRGPADLEQLILDVLTSKTKGLDDLKRKKGLVEKALRRSRQAG